MACALTLSMLIAMAAPQTMRGEIVDRVVAVVEAKLVGGAPGAGQIVTWSAVYAAACYEAFQKGSPPPQWSAAEASASPQFREVLSRLVDQVLLRQLLNRSPFAPSGDGDSQARFEAIQKRFPDDAAFRRELERYHLSETALADQLASEALVLAFVDASLRPDIRIAPEQVENYYRTVFLPQWNVRSSGQARVPALDEVRPQIQEILTQQEMDRRLEQWLAQLRRDARMDLRLN
jgi:hypothetical protein